jgi:hypothetical protein
MKLEDQVCSLELAKRLKELGIKQESEFYWLDGNVMSVDKIEWARIEFNSELTTYSLKEIYSAFTVVELGEGLPDKMEFTNGTEISSKGSHILYFWCVMGVEKRIYCIGFYDRPETLQIADTEANARALMLIYLIENGLVKI